MPKANEIEYEFIFDNEPDEETLIEFHRSLAQSYIDKYGVENMKKVLEVLKSQQT